MNELAWDEIIVGLVSLLSVITGTFVQKQRTKAAVSAVVQEETLSSIPSERIHTPTSSQDDLVNVIINLNRDNVLLRKRLKDK
jgi:hypothetical protein